MEPTAVSVSELHTDTWCDRGCGPLRRSRGSGKLLAWSRTICTARLRNSAGCGLVVIFFLSMESNPSRVLLFEHAGTVQTLAASQLAT
jgi:hypothetical protein